MTLLPIFKAQIELDANQLSVDNFPSNYVHDSKYIDINGVKTRLQTIIEKKYKLTRLVCFLNLEGTRKILRREKFGKVNLIEPFSLNRNKYKKEMEYSHIEICIKFENRGNYFVIIANPSNAGFIQFFVKIGKENEEKCVFKIFKKMDVVEKKVLENLRRYLSICVTKTKIDDIEDGQMNVYNDQLSNNCRINLIASIKPYLNKRIYEFYLDKEGITKEVEKMVDSNNEIINFNF